MKALSGAGSVEQRVVAVLAAGTDMVMISGGAGLGQVRQAILDAVRNGTLSLDRLKDAASRIVRQKLMYGLAGDTSAARLARYKGFSAMVETHADALNAPSPMGIQP